MKAGSATGVVRFALASLMSRSTTTSVGPPMRIRCSTSSRRTRTSRLWLSTAVASITARRVLRLRPPATKVPKFMLRIIFTMNSTATNAASATRTQKMAAPYPFPPALSRKSGIGTPGSVAKTEGWPKKSNMTVERSGAPPQVASPVYQRGDRHLRRSFHVRGAFYAESCPFGLFRARRI